MKQIIINLVGMTEPNVGMLKYHLDKMGVISLKKKNDLFTILFLEMPLYLLLIF